MLLVTCGQRRQSVVLAALPFILGEILHLWKIILMIRAVAMF
jgi:hypothetical protein